MDSGDGHGHLCQQDDWSRDLEIPCLGVDLFDPIIQHLWFLTRNGWNPGKHELGTVFEEFHEGFMPGGDSTSLCACVGLEDPWSQALRVDAVWCEKLRGDIKRRIPERRWLDVRRRWPGIRSIQRAGNDCGISRGFVELVPKRLQAHALNARTNEADPIWMNFMFAGDAMLFDIGPGCD